MRPLKLLLVAAAALVTPRAGSAAVEVNMADERQVMDGFGANAMWIPPITAEQARLFFDPTTGAGLTLLRVGIYGGLAGGSHIVTPADAFPNRVGPNDPSSIAQYAASYGVQIHAAGAGWYPYGQAYWKPWANPTAWANEVIPAFIATSSAAGIPIAAIEVQVEPDTNFNQGSQTIAEWTALAEAVTAKVRSDYPAMKIVAPSTVSPSAAETWFNHMSPAARARIDFANTHTYFEDFSAGHTTFAGSRHVIMGEVCDDGPWDGSIASALTYAKKLHNALTVGNVSAWMYWQFWDNDGVATWALDSNWGFLRDTNGANPGEVSKRLWMLGQWSRFVRPGARRVGATGAPAGVYVTAFVKEGGLSIIAVNDNATGTAISGTISDGRSRTLTPYVTDATRDLAPLASITSSSGAWSYTLPAKSIVSFVALPPPLYPLPLKDRSGRAVTLKARSGAAVAVKGRQ